MDMKMPFGRFYVCRCGGWQGQRSTPAALLRGPSRAQNTPSAPLALCCWPARLQRRIRRADGQHAAGQETALLTPVCMSLQTSRLAMKQAIHTCQQACLRIKCSLGLLESKLAFSIPRCHHLQVSPWCRRPLVSVVMKDNSTCWLLHPIAVQVRSWSARTCMASSRWDMAARASSHCWSSIRLSECSVRKSVAARSNCTWAA